MNALANPRPQLIRRETFEAFFITEGGLSGIAIRPLHVDADTLEACVESGATLTAHGNKFMVRQVDHQTDKVTLRIYVKRRKSRGVKRFHEHQTRTVHDEYADLLVTLDGAALAAIHDTNGD